jgi:glyoxylase-like metal-dependent hydrolase (beta-lactamase superfamily II)
MQEIAPGIFVESSYPPYNLSLIKLDEGALAIDIPPRPSHAAQWLRQAQETVGSIRYAVITNASIERLIGAALWDIAVIAAEAAARAILSKDDKMWGELMREAAETLCPDDTCPEDANVLTALKPNRVKLAFNQYLRLHRRSPSLIFEIIDGPVPGGMGVLVPDQELLFAGDAVAINEAPPITLGPDPNAATSPEKNLERTPRKRKDIQRWLKSLEELENRRDIRRIVPGRGETLIRPGELEKQLEFMNVLLKTANRLANNEANAGEISNEAWDLTQAFFPNTSRQSTRLQGVKQALDNLILSIRPPIDTEDEAKS